MVVTDTMIEKAMSCQVMDRSKLGFVNEVADAFRFLVDEFGFRVSRCEAHTFVRFESERIFFNVYHGRQSYELNVEIGRISDPTGRSYRLSDVINAILGGDDRRQTNFQASDPQGVCRCVWAIADLVAKYFGPVLRNDAEVWCQVTAYTTEINQASTREVIQRPVREAADKAWRAKDYAQVETLYASIEDQLTPTERQRLIYASKHKG